MPRADLTGMERKKTLSWGAVRLTKPRPIVARNMMMTTGAVRIIVIRMRPSAAPRTFMGASAVICR